MNENAYVNTLRSKGIGINGNRMPGNLFKYII